MLDPPPSSDDNPVGEGSQGAEVRDIQSFLNKLGAHLTVDGIFGPATEQAVRQFQTAHHLASDGIVGPMTWTALDTALVSAAPKPSSPTADSGKHWSAENDHVVVEMISAALKTNGNDFHLANVDLSNQRQQPQNFYNTNMAIAANYLRAGYETERYGPWFALAETDVYMELKKTGHAPPPVGAGPVSPYSEREEYFMKAGVNAAVAEMSAWSLGIHTLLPQVDVTHMAADRAWAYLSAKFG